MNTVTKDTKPSHKREEKEQRREERDHEQEQRDTEDEDAANRPDKAPKGTGQDA